MTVGSARGAKWLGSAALAACLGAVGVGAVGLDAVGASSSARAASDTIKFAPHRAIYDVTLGRAAPGSGVNDMTGRLVYELTGGGCEDYAQSMRFVTQSSSSDGTEQINDMRTTSSEEAEGRRLRFTSTQYHDDQLGDVTEGKAGRRGASGELAIELSKPETRALSLPGSIYFPIQHSIAMLQAAIAGKTRFEADVYDGSEKGDKISATMTIIGQGHVADAKSLPPTVANIDRLKPLRFWPVSTSYFDKGKALETKDALPNYEMAANFYENGVSTRLLMDYGDFSLKGELKELTFLDEPKCGAGK